jgi:hypothetical protein
LHPRSFPRPSRLNAGPSRAERGRPDARPAAAKLHSASLKLPTVQRRVPPIERRARGAIGSSAPSDEDTSGCGRDELSPELHIAGTFRQLFGVNIMLPWMSRCLPLGRLLRTRRLRRLRRSRKIAGFHYRIGDRLRDGREPGAPSPLLPTPRGTPGAVRRLRSGDHSRARFAISRTASAYFTAVSR